MSAYTTKYRLTKPTVGGDADAWGGLLNSDMDSLDTLLGVIATGGSANAYTLTTGQSLTAYADGQTFNVRASFTNTGAATMNIDALGAKNLRKVVSGTLTALASGDIASGDYMRVSYNLASDVIVVHGGSSTLDATLVAMAAGTTGADVLWYWSGTDTLSTTTLTAAGRALLDDANAGAQRTTLGLAIGSDVQAYDADTAKLDVQQNWTANQLFGGSTANVATFYRAGDSAKSRWVESTNNNAWGARNDANTLKLDYNGTDRLELDPSGNLQVDGAITASGSTVLTTATGAQLGAANTFTAAQTINNVSGAGDTDVLWFGNSQANGALVCNGSSVYLDSNSGGWNTALRCNGTQGVYVNSSGDTLITAAPAVLATNSAGFRGLGAPSVKTANYTFVIGDVGQVTRHNSASSHTFTIPTQASVAYPNGTVLPVENIGAGTMVLAPDTGVTLLSDAGASGSITLNQHHGGTLIRDADTGTNTWRYRGSHA